MPDDTETLAEVLAAHDFDFSGVRIQRDEDNKATGYMLACKCGLVFPPDPEIPHHRNHPAEVLAARIVQARRDDPGEAVSPNLSGTAPLIPTDAGEGALRWIDLQPGIRQRLHEMRGHGPVPAAVDCAACDQDADQLARAALTASDVPSDGPASVSDADTADPS